MSVQTIREFKITHDGDRIVYSARAITTQPEKIKETFDSQPVTFSSTHGPLCNGFLDWIPITEYHQVLHCRHCGLRVRFPASIKTIADLKNYLAGGLP
jgi:hypothetical protein